MRPLKTAISIPPLFLCALLIPGTAQGAGELVPVGNQVQVLIDDYVVESLDGLYRRIVPLTKHPANPVLQPREAWEGRFAMPISVFYDAVLKSFRMWYRPGPDKFALAYATSKDGVHWEKPPLHLVPFQGSKENNLLAVRTGPAWNGILLDEREPDPVKKFKLLSYNTAKKSNGLFLHYSADGFSWTPHSKTPLLEGLADCHHLMGWDPSIGQYVAFVRPDKAIRTIARTTSPDMIRWSEYQSVLEPDEVDPPGTQLYGMPVYRDRGMYYGMLWIYHPNQLTVDVQLAYSRDGIKWRRTARRHPVLSFGLPHQFDSHQVFALAPVPVGDELKVFYMGQDAPHALVYNNEAYPPLKTPLPRKDQPWLEKRSGAMGLASCLRDRFVALEANEKMGNMITKPFKLSGRNLVFNADVSRGDIRLELLDEEGKPFPAFSGPRAGRVYGNGVHLKAVWRGVADLASVQGRAVKLRVQMRYAKLYSFQVPAENE